MRTVVCGIGNRMRGDDAAGPLVIDKLKSVIRTKDVLLLDCGELPENLITQITKFKPNKLILIDSADLGSEPGAFREISQDEIKDHVLSTHRMPLTMLVKFLNSRIKFDLVFIGIQPKQSGLNEPVSLECKMAVRKVTELVTEMI
ncbi:hydrogenase maturation peptidase HycI [Candidatus Aenigmatarchaeota archaeon]